MRFVSEDYSGYFRRSLAALEAKSADPQSIRRLLGERVTMPVDASAIDALLDAVCGYLPAATVTERPVGEREEGEDEPWSPI
ncbi:MAG: hypothetical protein ACO3AD_14700 [Burkholderiaceae bacterium]